MNFDHSFAERIHLRLDAEARRFRCRHAPIYALWCAVSGADGHVAVEVGRAEEELRGRAAQKDAKSKESRPRFDAGGETVASDMTNFWMENLTAPKLTGRPCSTRDARR